jgi:hypothetical protein
MNGYVQHGGGPVPGMRPPGPPPAGVPPHSNREPGRSRSPVPGPSHSSARQPHGFVDPRQLQRDMGKAAFNKLMLEGLLAMSPDEFADIWVGLPRGHRNVAWRPPPGIVVDIDTLKGQDRMIMCGKLNALRRERCVQLASPKQRPHFEDENWTITPMSRHCCAHFWECFRLLPLATTNESKWKSTVKYLSKCPEKPEPQSDVSRHVDVSARASSPDPVKLERGDEPRTVQKAPRQGLSALSSLAAMTPDKLPVDEAPGDPNSEVG